MHASAMLSWSICWHVPNAVHLSTICVTSRKKCAVAVGFKSGLFNIGVEGQYRMAAFWAAAIGAKVSLPAVP